MMANWRSMEVELPAAAAQSWVHADWRSTMEEASAAQSWVPADNIPAVEQQQLVAAYAGVATDHYFAVEEDGQYINIDDGVEHNPIIHDEEEVAVKIHDDVMHAYEEAADAFESDMKKMGVKMHMYPISLYSYLGKRRSIPSTVSIGPYHHGLPHLQEAEKVKHVAAFHCIKQSGHSLQDMYDAVVSDTGYARSLYDRNTVAEMSDHDFEHMMFHDACFLVQYMLSCTLDGYSKMDQSLRSYFDANDEAIFNDVMILENQLPWQVVETLMKFRDVPLEEVASYARSYLQDIKDLKYAEPVTLDDNYKPPHLLGFLRFYMVGRRSDINGNDDDDDTKLLNQLASFSVSAIELAEMGIDIKVSETMDLMDIGIKENQYSLFLPQVSLDDSRACILVNMAAFELCTIPDFLGDEADEEDSAVCSYLQLLGMLIDRTEDVQELRRKRVLQGGGGLTDEQVLQFFTCIQDLRSGSRYIRTMEEIENYKLENMPRVLWKSFVYNHWNPIVIVVKVFGFITALAGILGTFASFKKS